jgi:hypothetical protein
VQKDGSFHIWNTDPGSYYLIARLSSQGQELRSSPVEVEVADRNIEQVELRMTPAVDMSGQVEYFDEQAKKGPQFQPSGPNARPLSPPLMLRVTNADTKYAEQRQAAVAADGAFQVKGLQPGRYRIAASWQTVYVRSLRLGSQVIDGDVFDIRNGGSGLSLAVSLSSGLAELDGVVKDSKGPVADADVLVVSDTQGQSQVVRTLKSGKDGSYRALLLRPGTYRVLAADSGDGAATQGIGLENYEAGTEKVELRERDKVTRDLRRADQ